MLLFGALVGVDGQAIAFSSGSPSLQITYDWTITKQVGGGSGVALTVSSLQMTQTMSEQCASHLYNVKLNVGQLGSHVMHISNVARKNSSCQNASAVSQGLLLCTTTGQQQSINHASTLPSSSYAVAVHGSVDSGCSTSDPGLTMLLLCAGTTGRAWGAC